MKTEQQIEFDFKKVENDSIEVSKEENIIDMTLNTLGTQFTLVISYILIALVVFNLTSISLLGISFLLAKAIVALNAIGSALKDRKKSIKSQIFNNTLNLGIFLYLFKYDGFTNLVNLFHSVF